MGKCLTAWDWGYAAYIDWCDGSDDQHLQVLQWPDGLVITKWGGCLQPLGNADIDNAAGFAKCDGSTLQVWSWESDGTLRNLSEDTCLDIPGADNYPQALLIAWPCNGNENQIWGFD